MFAVPDLTVPVPGATRRPLPPATILRAVAADVPRWRRLLRYDPAAPHRIELPDDLHPHLRIWLYTWLQGQDAIAPDPGSVFTVVAGTITEFTATGRRTLQAGQTRVLADGRLGRLANLGERPAVTVHAAEPITS
jgi:hypothetical protein